jgi:hypothetical protein
MEVYYIKRIKYDEQGNKSEIVQDVDRMKMFSTAELAAEEIKKKIAYLNSDKCCLKVFVATFDSEKLFGYAEVEGRLSGCAIKTKWVIMRKALDSDILFLGDERVRHI